mgnify:FL=1|tara:strand:+ start:727 stop:900 length:174 start_codon:yes stop_codon:yes gene_type:complete
MPDEQSVDIFNEPSFIAANRAFEQLQSFLKRMPNPPGYAAKKSQLSSADINRLVKGD